MKIILVDAVHTFITEEGMIDPKIEELLDQYDTSKIILTNASIEKFQELAMDLLPHPVFTLSRNPAKSEPEYFEMLMQEYSLFPSECVYFEHDKAATEAAQSIGITSYYFDAKKRDIRALQDFLDTNLT